MWVVLANETFTNVIELMMTLLVLLRNISDWLFSIINPAASYARIIAVIHKRVIGTPVCFIYDDAWLYREDYAEAG